MKKNTNKIIILTLALLLAPMSAMASFSDDFNDSDISDWTVTSGAWTVSPTPYYLHATADPSGISHAIGTGIKFIQIDFNSVAVAGTSDVADICWATNRCMRLYYTGGQKLSATGFTITPVSTAYNINYRAQFTIVNSNTQILFQLYNLDTGALITSEQVAYTYVESASVTISANPSGDNTYYWYNYVNFQSNPTSASTQISWLLPGYTIGDSPTFSWTITDTDWNSHPLQIYVARLYKSGIMQDWGTFNYACLCSSQLAVAQLGSYTVSADVPGTYLVTLELMYPIIGANSVVDDSSTSVHAQSSSYFTIPTTANQNTNVSAVFHLGTGGMNGVLQTFWIDGDGLEQFEKSFYTTGLDGTQNILFNRVGRYNVKLYNYNDGTLLQTKSINIVFVPNIPIGNFATSSINTTSTTYNRYDVLSGSYRIDAVNFTIGTPYISIYNYDLGAETARFYNQNGQSGMISGVYFGTIDYGVFDYYIVNSASGTPVVWLAGNNSVRLMMQNSTSSALTVLAYSNFTLSDLDSTGYGLAVQPTTVNINENVRITTTCPSDCIVSVSRPNGGSSAYNMSSGTRTMFQAYPTPGKWGIALMDSGGHVHMTVIVTVTSGVSPGVTPPSGSVTINTAVSLLNVFSIMAFWGFVIWLGIIGSVIVSMSNSASGINGTAIIAIAWFSAIFIAIIGLFDPFKIYIIVISTIIAAVYFKFGRSATTGDE